MTNDRTPFYVTTAIDYPNGAPHIGHSLEKVAADVGARYHRLLGDDTVFCMGLDENSQHIVKAAEKNGMAPSSWTDAMEIAFLKSWNALDISINAWTRTSEPRHIVASQELFRRASENGDIYKAQYSGWYCPNCNTYYAESDLVDGHCPNHPTVHPEWIEEENYFFALSKYENCLREHFDRFPEFITPSVWKREVVALLDSGLKDFSVSRKVRPGHDPWGIPVPGDPEHVMYVWFDALTTYLTAIGFQEDDDRFNRFWPANAQLIGKDITRFHCLYWPAMLMSAGLPLPDHVVVHGFMTLEGKRISTTTGNIIDPVELAEEFGADPIRFYLMRDVSLSADGDFSRANLIKRYNDDLGNDLGNLLNRVVAMIGRYREGNVPVSGEEGLLETQVRTIADSARAQGGQLIETWDLDDAIEAIWNLVRRANQYIEERQPWKQAKDIEQEIGLNTTLWTAAETLRQAAILLAPFIPTTSNRILAQLGLPPVADGDLQSRINWGSEAFGTVDAQGPIFPRIESSDS